MFQNRRVVWVSPGQTKPRHGAIPLHEPFGRVQVARESTDSAGAIGNDADGAWPLLVEGLDRLEVDRCAGTLDGLRPSDATS